MKNQQKENGVPSGGLIFKLFFINNNKIIKSIKKIYFQEKIPYDKKNTTKSFFLKKKIFSPPQWIGGRHLKTSSFGFGFKNILQFLFSNQKNRPLMAMEPTSHKVINLILGWILFILGGAMMIPLCIAYGYKESSFEAFFLGSFFSFFLGGVLILSSVGKFQSSQFFLEKKFHLSLSDGFFLTFLCWIVISLGASLPFYGSCLFLKTPSLQEFFTFPEEEKISLETLCEKKYQKKNIHHGAQKFSVSEIFADNALVNHIVKKTQDMSYFGTSFSGSLFEAVSSLTTTGISLIQEKTLNKQMDRALHFWRIFCQFLGGFGIMLMAITLLPGLKIGGSQLAMTEFSDFWEKKTPRNSDIARDLFFLYFGATLLGALGLFMGGLDILDALSYSVSALSTGGIALPHLPLKFLSPWCKTLLIGLMILGGTTFSLIIGHYGGYKKIWKDHQWRTYMRLLLFSSGLTVLYMLWKHPYENNHLMSSYPSIVQSLDGVFMAVSALTGVGFSLHGSNTGFLGFFFFLLSMIGGCSGSVSGGIKIFRFHILYAMAKNHILGILYPYGVFLTSYNAKEVTYKTLTSIMAIVFFYVVGWLIFGLGFTVFNREFSTALSLSGALITNSGLSFGGNEMDLSLHLSIGERYWAILAMICGRFEFLTFLVVVGKLFMKKL